MKKYLLVVAALSLIGCENRVSKSLEANTHGQVIINGKDCEVVSINIGEAQGRVLFVDCGVGSSSVTYSQGKTQQSVGQYTPPVNSACSCPGRDTTEDLKKIQEIKKDFYK